MNIQNLKDLYTKATQGEWVTGQHATTLVKSKDGRYPVANVLEQYDTDFIVALVNAFPDILKELEEYESRKAMLVEFNDTLEMLNNAAKAGEGLAEAVERWNRGNDFVAIRAAINDYKEAHARYNEQVDR